MSDANGYWDLSSRSTYMGTDYATTTQTIYLGTELYTVWTELLERYVKGDTESLRINSIKKHIKIL